MSELISTFGIDWRLLLIQAVNFGILMLALWWFLFRPLGRIIEERRAKIEEGVRAANEAEANRERARTEREAVLAEAANEGERMIAEARAAASERGEELVREAEAKAEALKQEAEARAKETHEQALRGSEKEIARAAVLAAEKILRQKA